VFTSAILENPTAAHANFMSRSVIERELWAIEFNIVGIGIKDSFCSCDLDVDPIT